MSRPSVTRVGQPRRPLTGRPAAVLAAAAVLASPTAAAGQRVSVPLAGDDGVTLQGALDRFEGSISVPPRWVSWDGRVVLRWGSSRELAAGSQLRVRVGGRIVGVTELDGEAGTASFAVPRAARRGRDASIPVLIETRLRTKQRACPGPDDLGAVLQLNGASRVELAGRWAQSAPLLRQLPGALVTGVGGAPTKLLVRFPGGATPDLLRAASVAVGEIAAAAGGAGVQVRVTTHHAGTAPRTGEASLTIASTAGPGRIEVVGGAGGPPSVRLTGDSEGLIRAAGALRPAVARELRGRAATDLPEASAVTRSALPRRLPLPSGRFEGLGDGNVTLNFNLPVDRQVLRGARLRLAADYDAPGGGRATVSVNDRLIRTETLAPSGATRLQIEEQLAGRGPALQRADLRAGANRITINADLGYPEGLCNRPEQTGSIAVSENPSITLLTRERPAEVTLSSFPFPLSRNPGWRGTTVVLPTAPTAGELAAVLEALGAARRASGELALPRYQFGGAVPAGANALVLTRPGAAPRELVDGVPGPKSAGVLAASGEPGAVRITAIGPRALAAFDGGYEIGDVSGRVVQVTAEGNAVTRLPDAQRVTGVERGATSWRWPLVIVIVSVAGLFFLGLRGATRRVREARA